MAIDEGAHSEFGGDASALGTTHAVGDHGDRTKLLTLVVAARITSHAIFVAVTRTPLARNPEAELQSIGSTSLFVCCESGRVHLLGIRVVRRALNGVRALRLIFARDGRLQCRGLQRGKRPTGRDYLMITRVSKLLRCKKVRQRS
jgi:hypothetical protein